MASRGSNYTETEGNSIFARLDQGYTPETCERRATDSWCLLFFLASVPALVHIYLYGAGHGHPSKLIGLSDYQGRACGVSTSVAAEPYLYLCKDPLDGTLDLEHPICVARCPRDESTRTYCPLRGGGPRYIPDYPTEPYASMLCLPTSAQSKDQPGMGLLTLPAQISHSVWAIVIAVIVALLLGFGHIFLLRRFGLDFAWVGLVLFVGGLLAVGTRLIFISFEGSNVGGDKTTAFYAGVAACVAAPALLYVAYCGREDLQLARDVMRAAIECILDSRSLVLEPFVTLAIQGVSLLLFLKGLVLLISCGEWSEEGLVFHQPVPLLLLVYLLVSAWVMETCIAFSHFVVSYVAEEWFFSSYDAIFFTKGITPCVAGRGCIAGVRYHLGSMARGSLTIALVRGPRRLMTCVARASSANNAISGCVHQVCSCCLTFFAKHMECLNRTAYMEVALNALPFDRAAHHAMEVLSDEATDALMLHGATWLIELASSGGVTAAAVALTHLILTWLPTFSDPDSKYHVENLVLVDIVSALICFPIAMHFALIVGYVSDCLVFCCAVERTRNPLSSLAADVEDRVCSPLCMSRRKTVSEPENPNHLPHTRRLLKSMSTSSSRCLVQKR